MNTKRKIIIIKTIAILLSIAVAFFFARASFLRSFLLSTKKSKIIGSFIAGIFVASGFTTAPALVILAEIARKNSVLQTALIGGLGAFLGDFIIFLFIKRNFAHVCVQAVENVKSAKIARLVKSKIFKPLTIALGAFIIASPFPDEIGLMLMGISYMNTSTFFFIIFPLQVTSIFIMGSFVRTI